MPIYELECAACGKKEDVIIGLSEFSELQKTSMDQDGCIDLSALGISCKACNKNIFKKLITAHGKTAHNWSAWQRKP